MHMDVKLTIRNSVRAHEVLLMNSIKVWVKSSSNLIGLTESLSNDDGNPENN